MRENGITINEMAFLFLAKYNLLQENKLTNAAYLLFKNNGSIITTIKLGRFQDPVTIKDSSRTKSDILTQVDEVINYVKKHISLEVIIAGEPRNTQKGQYPQWKQCAKSCYIRIRSLIDNERRNTERKSG